MSNSFFYQPHVHTAEGVLTPDLLIDHLSIATPDGPPLPLTIDLLTTGTALQQIGDTAGGNAALVLVSAGRGAVATVGSAHWDPRLGPDTPWLAYQVAAKPLSREAVRLSLLAGDPAGFVLRTFRRREGANETIGETPLGELAGFSAAMDLWNSDAAPDHAALMLATGHVDPDPAGADGYLVELAGAQGGRTAALSYNVEQLTL